MTSMCCAPTVGIDAGMSRFVGATPSEPVVYTPPSRETLIVLEGEARVEITGGPTLELRPGVLGLDPGRHRNHMARDAAVQGVLGHRLTRWAALLALEALDVQDRGGSFRLRAQPRRHAHADRGRLDAEQAMHQDGVGAVELHEGDHDGLVQRFTVDADVPDRERLERAARTALGVGA